MSTSGEIMLEDFIYPMAILKKTSRELYHETTEKYKISMGQSFPFDVLNGVSELIF